MLPSRKLPLKKEESGSDETSGSAHKKQKAFAKHYRIPKAQQIHTRICQSIKVPLEMKELFHEESSEFKLSIDCALLESNAYEILTCLSINTKCSLLMDILHLPFAKDESTQPQFFSFFCVTEEQAMQRCNAMLQQMLKSIIIKPLIFRALILTPCVGKSTLHAAIETKSVDVVKTYLNWLKTAIQSNILSSREIHEELIMRLGPNNKNIFSLVNEIGNLEILHQLIQFINEVYPEKYSANVILEHLFLSVHSAIPAFQSIKEYFIAHSQRARLAAAESAVQDLTQHLEIEKAKLADQQATHALEKYDRERHGRELAGKVSELRQDLRQVQAQEQRAATEVEALRCELAAERGEHYQIVERLRRELVLESGARQVAQQELTVVDRNYLRLRHEYDHLAALYNTQSSQLTHELAAKEKLRSNLDDVQSQLHNVEAELLRRTQENTLTKAELQDLSIRFNHIQNILEERDRRDRYQPGHRSGYERFFPERHDALPRGDDGERRDRRNPGKGW